MGRFEAGHKYLRVEAAFDFGRIGAFEKDFDSFFEIRRGGFDRVSWLATSSSGQSAT
jgi:hypothetical protein